jgi:hypothetical protein
LHQLNRSDITLQSPDAPKPYYGNYVQPKCNRPDARAKSSGRGLIMEAFSAILERWLKLTVRTLGQTVWTSSNILIITFYSKVVSFHFHPLGLLDLWMDLVDKLSFGMDGVEGKIERL